MIGSTLSHYRITAELGRGGMGIVYRAEDTKLDRTVALKLLPPHALASDDDRARFQREARAAAKLHHPHIASIFEIGEAAIVPEGADPAVVAASTSADVRPFIAMEFVDGESLAARVARGPLKLDEAVRIASQIADALGAAHEAGIVHRDVKSGNVMLTSKGEAKVLDFGLAQTAASTKLTRMGSTLGTVAFMSPEQARGEEVDRRSDLWSLGIVLYEMIAGRLPFIADYEQAALYGILNEDPEPLTAVRTGVPMELEAVVSKLLRKEARLRYQSAGDLVADLEAVMPLVRGGGSGVSSRSRPVAGASAKGERAVPEGRARAFSAWGLVAGLLIGSLVMAAILGRSGSDPIRVSTKHIEQEFPMRGAVIAVDISPDGTKLAYSSDMVRVVDLATGAVRDLPEAGTAVHLEFSRDSRTLLITQSAGVARIDLAGGSLLPILESSEGGPRAVWGPGDWILYEEANSIFRVSLASGRPERVTAPDSSAGEYDHDWPMLLPDGRTLAATVENRDRPAQIGFWDLETGERKGSLDLPGYRVQWVPTGFLVFEMDGTIVAVPFDPDDLRQTGPTISVADSARGEGLSVADDGTLVHAGAEIGIQAESVPVVPMMMGLEDGLQLQFKNLVADYYRDTRVSPDGGRLATVIQEEADPASGQDIWIIDPERGTRRRLTEGGTGDYPAWSSDGRAVYYVRRTPDSRTAEVVRRAVDGTGTETVLVNSDSPGKADLAVSSDGTMVAYAGGLPDLVDQLTSIRVVSIGSGPATVMRDWGYRDGSEHAASDQNPRHPAFSPDGRYLAFESSGAINVLSLSDPDAIPVTAWDRGMSLPRWSSDGRRLFAVAEDGSPHVVEVDLDPSFALASVPRQAINWPVAGVRLFDVFPGGNQVLVPTIGDAISVDDASRGAPRRPIGSIRIRFIINWFDELRRASEQGR